MIVTVLSVLLFIMTAAGKFIEVSFLAVIGLILKNAQRKTLNYQHSGSFRLIPLHFRPYSLQSCARLLLRCRVNF